MVSFRRRFNYLCTAVLPVIQLQTFNELGMKLLRHTLHHAGYEAEEYKRHQVTVQLVRAPYHNSCTLPAGSCCVESACAVPSNLHCRFRLLHGIRA